MTWPIPKGVPRREFDLALLHRGWKLTGAQYGAGTRSWYVEASGPAGRVVTLKGDKHEVLEQIAGLPLMAYARDVEAALRRLRYVDEGLADASPIYPREIARHVAARNAVAEARRQLEAALEEREEDASGRGALALG